MNERRNESFGLANRGCAKAVSLCLISASLLLSQSVYSKPAFAFELFGKKLFDSGSTEEIVADPVKYSVQFNVQGMSSEDEELLRGKSLLVEDAARPVSGSLGLLTKAKSDRDNLVGALYELARYGAVVSISIDGRNLSDLPPTAEFQVQNIVPVTIEITAGKEFRFGKTELKGDGFGISLVDFGIVSNGIASSNLIIEAQEAIVRKLRENGHPLATITDANIEADHDTGLLDVSISYLAGPMASIGNTSIAGAQDVDQEFIRQQAMLEPGTEYSPSELAAAKKRLLDLGVFESVTVSEGHQLDENGQLPIEVEVKERKFRYFGFGATYSNADGAGVESYWGHRNLFGRAEKLRVEGGINRIGENNDLSKLNFTTAILFEKPAAFGPKASFNANARAVSENYDAFERRSVRGGFGVKYKIDDRQDLSAALDLDWSRITEGKIQSRHLIVSAPLEYLHDGSDDRLDPTKGVRFSALLEPAHDLESGSSFVKGRLTASAYFTPGAAQYVTFAGRASVGSIIGSDLANIPADRRFYAGGGGSIRGYAFQGVGPKDATGRVTGGRSLFESSVEARIQISEKLGLVPFIDAGNVTSSSTPDFSDLRFGAGLGLRYKTPFGPLRLDVGVPLNPQPGDDDWAIYAGIGQSF